MDYSTREGEKETLWKRKRKKAVIATHTVPSVCHSCRVFFNVPRDPLRALPDCRPLMHSIAHKHVSCVGLRCVRACVCCKRSPQALVINKSVRFGVHKRLNCRRTKRRRICAQNSHVTVNCRLIVLNGMRTCVRVCAKAYAFCHKTNAQTSVEVALYAVSIRCMVAWWVGGFSNVSGFPFELMAFLNGVVWFWF